MSPEREKQEWVRMTAVNKRTKQVWNWVILGASLVAWGVIWLVAYGVTQ